MNTILLVCVLSVSQRPIGGWQGCAGGQCGVHKAAVATPVVKPLAQAYLPPSLYVADLKWELASNGRELYDASKAARIESAAKALAYTNSQSDEPPDANGNFASSYDETVSKLLDERRHLTEEIDRVQGLLIHAHRQAWADSVRVVDSGPGIVGAMQAAAVRRGVAGLWW